MSKKHFTLDEAIEHCYEVSKKKDICKECADEHLQLAKWLKELKTLRQKVKKDKEKMILLIVDGVLYHQIMQLIVVFVVIMKAGVARLPKVLMRQMRLPVWHSKI